jgi:hypothetical protein
MADEGAQKSRLKRVAKAELWKADPTLLYLDDVEEIYGLFQRVSDKVTLRLDGYELVSPADAAQLKATATKDFEISFSHRDPHAAFEARWGGFQFYAADRDDLVLIGLRDEIKRVVRKRRLWGGYWRTNLPWWLFIAASSWLIWLVPKGPLLLPIVLVCVAGNVALGGAVFIAYRNEVHRGGTVILRDSHAKPSFLQANRDLLLVLLGSVLGLVTIVIGGVIVYCIVYGLGLVGKP